MFLLSSLFYFPLLTGKTLYFADNIALIVPVRVAAKKIIQEGSFPFWSHDSVSGYPMYLENTLGLFYPPSWIFFLGDDSFVSSAITSFLFLHLVIGGVGIWYLGRAIGVRGLAPALASVVSWVGSSYILSVANNLVLLASASWVPWLLYAAIRLSRSPSRKTAGLMVTTVVLGWLSGHPQPWLFGLLGVGMIFLAQLGYQKEKLKYLRKLFLLLVPAVILTIGMVSFQLVPFLSYAENSTRAVQESTHLTQGSIHPGLLVHWLLPNFFSNPADGLVWGPEWNKIKQTHGFVGISGLLLVGVGLVSTFRSIRVRSGFQPSRLAIALLPVIGVGLSVGTAIPFIEWVYLQLPIIGTLRNPSASLVLWVVSAPVLLGYGLDQVSRWKTPARWISSLATLLTLGLGLIVLLWVASAQYGLQLRSILLSSGLISSEFFTPERFLMILSNSLAQLSIFLLTLTGLAWLLARKRKPIVIGGSIVVLLTLELVVGNQASRFYAPNDLYSEPSPQAEWLRTHLEPGYRYLSSTDVIPYTGFVSYFHDVVTHPPFSSFTRYTAEEQQAFTELRQRRKNLSSNWGGAYGLPTTYGYLTMLSQDSARYWNSARKAEDQTFQTDWQSSVNYLDHPSPGSQFLQLHGVRYYLLDTLIFSKQEFQDLYPGLEEIYHDSKNQFVVFEDPSATRWITGDLSDLSISPNKVEFSVNIPTQTETILLMQTFDSGWSCFSPTTACRVENYHGYQQLKLSQGEHQIILSYRPIGWSWLLLISGLSTTLFLGWWLLPRAVKR